MEIDTSILPNSSPNHFNLVKVEPIDSGSLLNSSPMDSDPVNSKSTKRKEREKKVKSSVKTSKNVVNETNGDKLPYVHVRARRGQATDSHSLAERARREKINAKMKLLQDLVPGCNKVLQWCNAKGAYVPPTMCAGAVRPTAGSDMRRRNDENPVRVNNLSEDTREPDLLELFRPFGNVSRGYVAMDQKTGMSRGFGFVNFLARFV